MMIGNELTRKKNISNEWKTGKGIFVFYSDYFAGGENNVNFTFR